MSNFLLKVWNLFVSMLRTATDGLSEECLPVSDVPSRSELELMTKKDIEALADDIYGIYVDIRKKKSDMIDKLLSELD